MKLCMLFALLLLNTQGFAHCGTCGEGTASDHQEMGTDSTHHESDSSDESAMKKNYQEESISAEETMDTEIDMSEGE